MSASSVELSKSGDVPASGERYVHALWLLRLVNLRRALRLVIGVELLAFPLWLGYVGLVQSGYQADSEVWRRLDDEILPGLIVLSVVFVATLAVLVLLGTPKGLPSLARRLVPLAGRGPKVSLQHDKGGAGAAVLARLRRRGFAQPVAIGILVLFAPIAVFTGAAAWPTWQANHGNGGRTFAISDTTPVTEETNTFRGSGRGSTTTSTTYTVATPDGTAIAESGRPRSGEQWLVNRDVFGNLRAYRIGAHDYFVVGLLFVVATGVVLGALGCQVEHVRRERRRRLADGRVTGDRAMAADLVLLAQGARPELRIGKLSAGRLGVPAAVAARDPWPALVGRKAAAGALGTGVVVVLAVLLAVQQTNLIGAPPMYRTVVLPYLDAAGYEREADIGYQTEFEEKSLVEWTGARVSRARQIEVVRRAAPGAAGSAQSVDLLLARSGADRDATVRRWERDLAGNGVIPIDVTQVSGLPSGCAGRWVVTRYRSSDDVELHALTVERGLVLEVTMNARYLTDDGEGNYPQPTIAQWVGRLGEALARVGLSRLEADTSRPESA